MFSQCNAKLQETRDLLVELIAELDMTLEDVRQARVDAAMRDGVDGEPDYVRNIVRQREALMNAATILADVRFEWSRELQQREA